LARFTKPLIALHTEKDVQDADAATELRKLVFSTEE